MAEINKYYVEMETEYRKKFKESKYNKNYYLPNMPLQSEDFEKITSLFMKGIKEEKVIGRGSFGCVSKCQIQGINKWCVMKKLKRVVKNIDDLKGEVGVLDLASKSKFLVKFFYAGFDLKDHYIIIMELVDGETLWNHILYNSHNISLDAMRVIFYQIANGLKNGLHSGHLTHGDLKPENVGLTAKGNVKLFDFGKSRNVSKPCILPRGTLTYEAPENIQRLEANESIDWWSYGILVATMIQKKHPFYHKDDSILQIMILLDEPNINIDDPNAKDFVMKLLQKDPAQRLKNPFDHIFIDDMYKAEPIYVPGRIFFSKKFQSNSEKSKSLNEGLDEFQVSADGKNKLLNDGLLRYPTRKCAKYIVQK